MASYILPIGLFVTVIIIVSAGPPNEKPFDCPANEQYHKCDQELCYKSCEHLRRPPACPSLDLNCFKPACLCVKGTLRNSEGKCVPYDLCPY